MEDPDIFCAEAELIVASGSSKDVLLYTKDSKLYQASPFCGLLCGGSSWRVSDIRDIEVVTGTVTVLHNLSLGTSLVKVHHINLGLKISVPHWFGDGVRIYDTPDAVELAGQMNPDLLRGPTIVPTRIDMTIRQPAPSSGGGGGGGGGGACGGGGGGCH